MKGKPIVVAVRNKTRDGLIPFAGSRESAVEEFGGGAAGVDPIVQEQVVNFVGDDYLFERDVLGAEFFDQISGLLGRNVAIVIAKSTSRRPERLMHGTSVVSALVFT
jgi:hypothetical protein